MSQETSNLPLTSEINYPDDSSIEISDEDEDIDNASNQDIDMEDDEDEEEALREETHADRGIEDAYDMHDEEEEDETPDDVNGSVATRRRILRITVTSSGAGAASPAEGPSLEPVLTRSSRTTSHNLASLPIAPKNSKEARQADMTQLEILEKKRVARLKRHEYREQEHHETVRRLLKGKASGNAASAATMDATETTTTEINSNVIMDRSGKRLQVEMEPYKETNEYGSAMVRHVSSAKDGNFVVVPEDTKDVNQLLGYTGGWTLT